MAQFDYLQEGFQGGELSPLLHARVGDPLYKVALAKCSDWQITPQGTIRKRPGTLFIEDLGDDSRQRLVAFPQSDGQDYLLLLSDQKMRLFSLASGLPFEAGASGLSFLTNGDFTDDGSSWNVTTHGGDSYVNFPDDDAAMAASWSNGDDHYSQMAQSFTPANTVAATLKIAWKKMYGDFDHVTVEVKRGSTIVLSKGFIPSAGTVSEFAVNLTAGSAHTLTFRVFARRKFSHSYFCKATIDWVSLTAGSGGSAAAYDLTTPWTAEQIAQVRFAYEPGHNRLYFAHPNVAPWSLERNPSTGAWTWQAITFTAKPSVWTGTNWPAVVEVFQGRLWFAATPNEGNTVWASQPADPFNFTVDNPVTAASAIVGPISTKGRIRWLRGRGVLLAGTSDGEYSISATSGVVSSVDMQAKQESAYASGNIDARDLGNHVLFASRDRRKVYAQEYALNSQAWMSHDLTYVAEHMTGAFIREIHFIRDPDSVLALLLEDGTFACCTYKRDAQLAAWWTADLGDVRTAAACHGDTGTILYVVVQRDAGVMLEAWSFSPVLADQVYCDAAVTYVHPDDVPPFVDWDPAGVYHQATGDGVAYKGWGYYARNPSLDPTPGVPPDEDVAWTREYPILWAYNAAGLPVLYGLDHLEGETVAIVLDGSVESSQVVANGAVTLERDGNAATIGRPFTCEGQTLPPARGAQRARRRWVKLWMRLNESSFPTVASSLDQDGVRVAPDRSGDTPWDTAEPLYTGDVGGRGLATNWENRGQVVFRQDLPLRTEILGVFGSMTEAEV